MEMFWMGKPTHAESYITGKVILKSQDFGDKANVIPKKVFIKHVYFKKLLISNQFRFIFSSRGVQIRSDFGTKIYISDWIDKVVS